MDFGNAALLIATVFALTEMVKRAVPTLNSKLTQPISVLIGIASAALIAHSDWGAKQIIDGIPLNTMNWGSIVLVGIALAAVATVAQQALVAVRNVGENQP